MAMLDLMYRIKNIVNAIASALQRKSLNELNQAIQAADEIGYNREDYQTCYSVQQVVQSTFLTSRYS
jgi:hypothetical protein